MHLDIKQIKIFGIVFRNDIQVHSYITISIYTNWKEHKY